jgi:hypothetical protein
MGYIQRVKLKIWRIDNSAQFLINKKAVFITAYYDEDPLLNIPEIDITDKLNVGQINTFSFVGFNGAYAAKPSAPNPWHFAYDLTFYWIDDKTQQVVASINPIGHVDISGISQPNMYLPYGVPFNFHWPLDWNPPAPFDTMQGQHGMSSRAPIGNIYKPNNKAYLFTELEEPFYVRDDAKG